MGMFDWVKYPAQPCWKCGKPVDGWQSKDADRGFAEVRPEDVRRFYNACRNCQAWNEYKVVVATYKVVPDHPAEEVKDEPQGH